MRWATHSVIALNSLWGLQILTPHTLVSSVGTLVACAVFGGLLPDLDAVDSKLQRLPILTVDFQPFQLLSRLIRQGSPHRGWMHSLRGLYLLSFLMGCFLTGSDIAFSANFLIGEVLTSLSLWIAFTGGYASHLLADMMNPSGIPLLYPQQRRCHVLPQDWRISTGSPEEELIFAFFACLALVFLMMLMNQPLL